MKVHTYIRQTSKLAVRLMSLILSCNQYYMASNVLRTLTKKISMTVLDNFRLHIPQKTTQKFDKKWKKCRRKQRKMTPGRTTQAVMRHCHSSRRYFYTTLVLCQNATSFRRRPYFIANQAMAIQGRPVLILHGLPTPFALETPLATHAVANLQSVFKDIAQLNPLFCDQITNFSINQSAVSSSEVGELQDVLESLVVDDRLRKALLVLKKELINAQLQSKLSWDVNSKIVKHQREY
ncbi:hypothetical protein M405DRAFT_879460 [Rhizopogon salebrosus TDB-379]|nr:hypothetical protein M405DRAFT_879460 [Rhizopogon salebrosus TDB-379]